MGKSLGRPETSFSCGLNPFSLPMADLHRNEHGGLHLRDVHLPRPEEQGMPNTRILLIEMQNGTRPTMCSIFIKVPKRPPLPVGENVVMTS